MDIYVACQCGQAFGAIADLAGHTVACPFCGQPLTIPQSLDVLPVAQLASAPALPKGRAAGPMSGGAPPQLPARLVALGLAGAAIAAVFVLALLVVWAQLGRIREIATRPGASAKGDVALAGQQPDATWQFPRSAARAFPRRSTAGQTHRSADGRVEVWLPSGARSQTLRSFGTSAGLADRTRVTWGNRSSGKFEATIYLYRGRHDDLAADTRMKVAAVQSLYAGYGSRISQSYQEIEHGGFRGTEAFTQVPGQRDNKFRFLYAGNCLVTLEAIGPPGFVDSEQARRFFNSLRLVP